MTKKEDEYSEMVLELDAWKSAAKRAVKNASIDSDSSDDWWTIDLDAMRPLIQMVDTL